MKMQKFVGVYVCALALEADFTVVGEASDGWEALAQVRELQPDVVVTGIRLQGLNGIALTERLLA